MSISGALFVATSNYIALITAAFIGTINVTGTEMGAFLSIEQAILPQTINDATKMNTVYALYNMVGTFAMSAGILASGLPSILEHEYRLNQIDSIRLLFVLYKSSIKLFIYESGPNHEEMEDVLCPKLRY